MYDEEAIDGVLLQRRRSETVSAEPTAEQIAAPVHIALTSWKAVTGGPDRTLRLRWIIVVADRAKVGRASEVIRGQLEPGDGDGWDRIIHDLTGAVANASGPAWVAVPRRMVATAGVLHAAGLAVTLGAAAENRAMARALEMMQVARTREPAAASPVQIAPPELSDDVGSCGASVAHGDSPSHDVAVCPENDGIVPEWMPAITEQIGESVDRLIVATDASISANLAATAAVAVGGGCAVETSDVATNPSDSELDAISLAIEHFGSHVGMELTILSDSFDAVTVARALIDDRVPVEGFRGIRDESLDRFEDAWADAACVVRIFQVKGHVGHPLNEAADELAYITRRAMTIPRDGVERELTARIAAVRDYLQRLSDDDVRVPGQLLSADSGQPMLWSLGSRLAG